MRQNATECNTFWRFENFCEAEEDGRIHHPQIKVARQTNSGAWPRSGMGLCLLALGDPARRVIGSRGGSRFSRSPAWKKIFTPYFH